MAPPLNPPLLPPAGGSAIDVMVWYMTCPSLVTVLTVVTTEGMSVVGVLLLGVASSSGDDVYGKVSRTDVPPCSRFQ